MCRRRRETGYLCTLARRSLLLLATTLLSDASCCCNCDGLTVGSCISRIENISRHKSPLVAASHGSLWPRMYFLLLHLVNVFVAMTTSPWRHSMMLSAWRQINRPFHSIHTSGFLPGHVTRRCLWTTLPLAWGLVHSI